ncbi:MAG: electron transport complex subunit RsxC, partial [Clostridia bacterium]|nr:electron transport complex subunit RsxC [Clostridia bacterium]
CLSVCPMGLFPSDIEKAFDSRNAEALKKANIDICMNCGCCSYACPAKRDLSNKNQLAKAFLKTVSAPKKEA